MVDGFTTTLCHMDTPVSSTNNTVRHDITEILLKVTLNTIALLVKVLILFSESCQIQDQTSF
jgi:hypothetical protein